MATLDVSDMIAIEFITETIVTAPDDNQFTASAGSRYGIPVGQTSMTVSVVGNYNCMLRSGRRGDDNVMPQVFTVNEVRASS